PAREYIRQLEALAAIRLSILLGRSIEEISACRVWRSGPTITEPLVLIAEKPIYQWQLAAASPAYRNPDVSDPDVVEIPTTYYQIPDIADAARHLPRLWKMVGSPPNAQAF